MEKERFSLKDHLFNAVKVRKLAGEIALVYDDFLSNKFEADVMLAFPKLELKERIYHLTNCLQKHLPADYFSAISILVQALPAPCNPELSDNDFGDFIYAPFAHYVAVYGCKKEYLQVSFNALEQITMRFSAEDAIRYFINAFPEETLVQMNLWANHSHYHVRRLASEGLRPKLPWCQKINIPVEAAMPILHLLHADKTRFVTRSVANHLNDISKSHPKLVIELLSTWIKVCKQKDVELLFITKHALRTLIKDGNHDALQLLGIGSNPPVKLMFFSMNQKLVFDEYLTISCVLLAEANCKLMIDYALIFKGKNGESNRRKVFKLKKVELKKGQEIEINKLHQLKQKMSTRTLYAGEQGFELQINGRVFWSGTFIIE